MYRLLFFLMVFVSTRVAAQTPDLTWFLDQAKSNSPLLADYRNQIEAGKTDSLLARAAYKVQVNGISNNYYAPVIRGYGFDNAITNGGQLSAITQASKTFTSAGNRANQYEAISLVNQAIANTGKISEKDLKKLVTAQYITVYGDQVTMQFNDEIRSLFDKEEKLLKELTRANTYKQADYLTFYVSLQQQALTVRQSQVQFKNDYAVLNYLAGLSDTSLVTLAAPMLDSATTQAVSSSAFYRQYVIDSLKLVNEKKGIAYSYKPRLGVYADAGYNSSFISEAYKNFGVGAGLTLSVPIYDGQQRQLKVRKIDIAERTRQEYRSYFIKQYDQEIARLQQQRAATASLIKDIDDQIRYSRTLVEVNQKLLETGEVRITDVILSINNYLNARHLLNQNAIAQLQIMNEINYWKGL